jgi:hypothetical protein
MKTTSIKLFQPATLAALAIAIVSGVSLRPAQAYTVTLQQVGSNVVATGSGAMDLTGLTGPFSGQGTGFGFIGPSSAIIETGPKGLTNFDSYGGFTGPALPATLAAETLSALTTSATTTLLTCHRDISPELLYQAARLGTTQLLQASK